MSGVVGLVAFSAVSSVTPGPNNLMLWGSGVQFGFRRTMPHVIGTPLGIGVTAVAVAAGIGVVVSTIPAVELVLKVAGSLYLLYLAYRIAASKALQRTRVARPLGLGQATLFQCLNPKAWIFALAAMGAFRPAGLPVVAGSALVAGVMMLVVLPTAALWAAGGTAIGRFITSERAYRMLSLGLAVLLAATVVQLWL